jgi:hypothetical protein
MNYDNLHTTAEILEAFQGCRDAGEQIDLFEALAWRDKPPWEAFIEILRRIKLESVLTLAIQALGWVQNEEVKERLKKSDDLLILLSNLAKSGETDLIRWSAAKSITAIGFNFINVSQHLTETPSEIIQNLLDKYSKGSSLENSSNNFWIYGDIAYFCSIANHVSLQKTTEVFERKGIRGIIEINSVLKKSLKNGTVDIFNCTMAGQHLSKKMLLNPSTTSTQMEWYRILLSNQIHCISSHHSAVKKAAIDFLCDVNSGIPILPDSLALEQELNKIRAITKEITSIAKEIEINIDHILFDDLKKILSDFKKINQEIEDNFDKACRSAEFVFLKRSSVADNCYSNASRQLSDDLLNKSLNTDKLRKSLESIDSKIKGQSLTFMELAFSCFLGLVLVNFCLWILIELPLDLLIHFFCKCNWFSDFFLTIHILVSIAFVALAIILHSGNLSGMINDKETAVKKKKSLDLECSEITKQIKKLESTKDSEIKQAKAERDSEIRQEEAKKNRKNTGLERIKDLLKEREEIHKFIN